MSIDMSLNFREKKILQNLSKYLRKYDKIYKFFLIET